GAGAAIVQVQMRPPVALRHPDDLGAVVDVEAPGPPAARQRPRGAAVVDERGRGLIDEYARMSGGRLDLDHPVALMPALVVLERETAAVAPPHETREIVGIGEERVVDVGLALLLDV